MSRSGGASTVQVCIRTRPTASFAQEHIIVHDDKSQLTVKMPKGDNPNAQDSWSWRYDAVLHNASQETVYSERVAPIVQSVLKGFNGTVMCYGQTGAGKTFTQIGSVESYQNRGITPRAVADVFQYISEHPQFDASVSVSYVEIYQDTLIDLLSSLPTSEPVTEPLALVEDKKGDTHVKNLRMIPVGSEEDALALLFEGQANRQTANHQLNRNSTRGHAIFTVHIRIRSRVDSSGVVNKCKLNLVDLAGSERLKKTETVGDLRSESMYINRSLTYLEQVVVALSSKGRSHTPYRQSKLTHLLKDSLGGNCKTLLIANVYGEQHHLEETISTLHFAARVWLVPNEAVLTPTLTPPTPTPPTPTPSQPPPTPPPTPPSPPPPTPTP
jgi:kinesin family protein 6/9